MARESVSSPCSERAFAAGARLDENGGDRCVQLFNSGEPWCLAADFESRQSMVVAIRESDENSGIIEAGLLEIHIVCQRVVFYPQRKCKPQDGGRRLRVHPIVPCGRPVPRAIWAQFEMLEQPWLRDPHEFHLGSLEI